MKGVQMRKKTKYEVVSVTGEDAEIGLSDYQSSQIARAIFDCFYEKIVEFYKDPENMRKFEAWKMEQERLKGEQVS